MLALPEGNIFRLKKKKENSAKVLLKIMHNNFTGM
jgi:hypothetical protein